jgi:MiaB-like tRNA modifying enzyme
MIKVYLETYGCSANQSDSEIILGLLEQAGFKIVDSLEKSDINLINTCVVKQPTEQRMIFRIKRLTETKKPLIVVGCMSKTERNIVEKLNPSASLIGPDSIERIVDIVNAALNGKKIVALEGLKKPKLCLPKVRKNSVIDIVEIAEGCAWYQCSYCIAKFARGKIFSYPIELIVKQIQNSLNDGCKEIWLTSQDTACYGIDINSNLTQLLEKIVKINGKFFVRIGMMNPTYAKTIIDDLIFIYKSEKIFKFLHMPVQSGSDKVLEDMNRGYTAKEFLDSIGKIKSKVSNMTISTDVIIGYPTETENDFKKTVDLIKKVRPDTVNISKFGARPGTDAAKLKQLDLKVVNERSKTLHELVKGISLENNKKWFGWNGETLVDEIGINETYMSRNFAYKPIVIKNNKNFLGKFVNVKIVDAKSNYLIGSVT